MLAGLAAWGVLVYLGLGTDFVPAPFLVSWPVVAACYAGGLVGMLGIFHLSRRISAYDAMSKVQWGISIVLLPLLIGAALWLGMSKCAPWAFTRAFGEPFKSVQLMQTHYSQSRRSCDFRLSVGLMERGFPNHLCIDEAAYRRFPERTIPVLLVGRRSVFGIQVEQVRLPR